MLILAVGFALRVVWMLANPAERMVPHESEMWHVADSFARTGTLADAYGAGSGVSAHVGPFNTMLAGYIYRLLGPGAGAEVTLSVLSISWVLITIAALFFAFRELKVPIVARLCAAGFFALMPLNFYLEVVDFRIREGAFAAMLSAIALLILLRWDRRTELRWPAFFAFACYCGLVFLVSPALALACYAGLGLLILRRFNVSRWPVAAVLIVLGLALVNAPWVWRNYQVYDRFLLSRGNGGLELAIANHPYAVAPEDARATFNKRLQAIHPFFTKEAFARYKQAPNDVVYAEALGQEAKAWILSHPADALTIWVRHLRELYFPPRWQWNIYYAGEPGGMLVRQAVAYGAVVLAALAFFIALIGRESRYLYALAALAGPTLPYVIVQPTLRYRYQLIALMTFLAFAALGLLVRKLRTGRFFNEAAPALGYSSSRITAST